MIVLPESIKFSLPSLENVFMPKTQHVLKIFLKAFPNIKM